MTGIYNNKCKQINSTQSVYREARSFKRNNAFLGVQQVVPFKGMTC